MNSPCQQTDVKMMKGALVKTDTEWSDIRKKNITHIFIPISVVQILFLVKSKSQMREMKDIVEGYSSWKCWISSEQQQPGQLSWDGEGGAQCLWGGVAGRWEVRRPEDSDYILRPVQGDWNQDCKPKHYLCCSGT